MEHGSLVMIGPELGKFRQHNLIERLQLDPREVRAKAAVRPGDDVLVTVASDPEGCLSAFIAELVSRSAGQLELRQFNPDTTFILTDHQFAGIHKIAGELI